MKRGKGWRKALNWHNSIKGGGPLEMFVLIYYYTKDLSVAGLEDGLVVQNWEVLQQGLERWQRQSHSM